jgi:flagellar hook protein FlgE
MPSFYIPLSGLDADSTALNTIANNLSNMSTTGFKGQTTNFSDLMYQQIGSNGSGDEIQVGTGVQVASNSTDFTGGSIASTDVSTNVAVSGTGFFVLDNNGSQLYTRDGDFQTSAAGTLESSNGQAVMGYAAADGVISPSSGLTDLAIPTSGSAMAPSATTTFSMTQSLDSASAAGATTTGKVEVYDSLGKSYEATVTYTSLGDNKWSYAITLPDTLTAAAPTAAAATTMPVTASTPVATAVPTDATVVAPAVTTVPSTVTKSSATTASTSTTLDSAAAVVLSTTSPAVTVDAPVLAAVVKSPLAAQTVPAPPAGAILYDFAGSGATVNTSTNLVISVPDMAGGTTNITAPSLSILLPQPVTVSAYKDALNTAIGALGIAGETAAASVTASGQLSIIGGAAIVSGSVSQDYPSTTASYNFAPTATIDAATALSPLTGLTITGPSTSGTVLTTAVPVFTGNPTETVNNYATDLNTALTAAGIVGVTVTGINATGVLSIAGPSTMVINNATDLKQDVANTTTDYKLVTSNGAVATIDPNSTLNISEGAILNITVPAFTTSEPVSTYATNLQTALTGAGITDVTVTGANGKLSITGPLNMSIGGAVVQDFSGTSTIYTLGSYADPTTGLSVLSAVDPSSTLKITGPTTGGSTASIALPLKFTGTPETITNYATDLTNALTAADITGVTVTADPTTGQLSIVGPTSMVIGGNLNQDMTGTTNDYTFESNATVAPTTNLTITGETSTGAAATLTAPTISSGETVAQYATDLNSALTKAGIQNVSVTPTAGQLSIVGANMTTTGSVRGGAKIDHKSARERRFVAE